MILQFKFQMPVGFHELSNVEIAVGQDQLEVMLEI